MTGFDPILAAYLVKGFSEGFDLGFRGHANNAIEVENLRSAQSHSQVIDLAIQKELLASRISGPYEEIPFDKFQLSPIGVVPKKSPGSYRMITNLSSPEGTSINDNISNVFSNVNYTSFAQAIRMIIDAGPKAFF